MHWIQTSMGRAFYPLKPRAQDVDIRDIAHSLSLLCRFNGHCRQFYSVAQHSVQVSRMVSPEHALWGLLHDAAEAYISDLPRPVKSQIPAFSELEDSLLEVVLGVFGLQMPIPAPVKHADLVLLATEKRDLMAPEPDKWGLGVQPLPEPIVPLAPHDAERAFLNRFQELQP